MRLDFWGNTGEPVEVQHTFAWRAHTGLVRRSQPSQPTTRVSQVPWPPTATTAHHRSRGPIAPPPPQVLPVPTSTSAVCVLCVLWLATASRWPLKHVSPNNLCAAVPTSPAHCSQPPCAQRWPHPPVWPPTDGVTTMNASPHDCILYQLCAVIPPARCAALFVVPSQNPC